MLAELFLKIINRFIGIYKVFFWKILFNKRLVLGRQVFFYPGCHMMIEKSGKIEIGDYCFFNRNCSITSLGSITIGKNSIFGENVKIYDHNHNFSIMDKPFKKQGYSIGKVIVGENVWIGSDVTILPNVTIGNNVVIGAGSIVTKNISDNVIYIQKRKGMEVPIGRFNH